MKKIHFVTIANFLTALTVSLISYGLLSFYDNGDQYAYREFYEYSKDRSLIEVVKNSFIFYGSSEPIYPVVMWLVPGSLGKDIFIALLNGMLAYTTLLALKNFRVPNIAAHVTVLTNFYFIVLYTSAERLKLSMLFFAIGLVLIGKSRLKSANIFYLISFLTHVQIIIIIIGDYLYNLPLLLSGKIHLLKYIYIALAIAAFYFSLIYLSDNIIGKLDYYSARESNLLGLGKITGFLLTSLYCARNKYRTIVRFMPILAAASFIGSERLVIFSFFMYLSVSAEKNTLLSYAILLSTILYFALKSVGYIENVVLFGDGFRNL